MGAALAAPFVLSPLVGLAVDRLGFRHVFITGALVIAVGALIAAGCVDEIVLYMAPMLLGDGKGIARIPGIERLEDAARFEFIETVRLGPDIRVRARNMSRWADLQSKLHLG